MAEAIDLAQKTGFEGIHLNIREAGDLADRKDIDYVRHLFESKQILPGSWSLPVAWRDEEQWAHDLEQLPELAALGRDLRCTRVNTFCPPSSDEREYAENFTWHVALCWPKTRSTRESWPITSIYRMLLSSITPSLLGIHTLNTRS